MKQDYFLAPNGLQAFESGSVDAWATFSTFIPLAEQNANARVLVWGGQVKTKNDTVYVVSSSFADKYPHLLKVIFRCPAGRDGKGHQEPVRLQHQHRDRRSPGAGRHHVPRQGRGAAASRQSFRREAVAGSGELLPQGGSRSQVSVTIAGNTVDVDQTK